MLIPPSGRRGTRATAGRLCAALSETARTTRSGRPARAATVAAAALSMSPHSAPESEARLRLSAALASSLSVPATGPMKLRAEERPACARADCSQSGSVSSVPPSGRITRSAKTRSPGRKPGSSPAAMPKLTMAPAPAATSRSASSAARLAQAPARAIRGACSGWDADPRSSRASAVIPVKTPMRIPPPM